MRVYLLVALAVSARLSASDDDDDRRPSPRALRRATDAERKFSENAVDARKLDEEKGGATPDLPQASNLADEGSVAENRNTDQELTAGLTEASGGEDDIWETTRRLLKPVSGRDQCATQNCGTFCRIGTRSNLDGKLLPLDIWDIHRVMDELHEEEFDYCWHHVETWVLGLLALSHAACFAGGVVFCWSASRRDATVTSSTSGPREPAQ